MKPSSMYNQYNTMEQYLTFLKTAKSITLITNPVLRSKLDSIGDLMVVYKKMAQKGITKGRNEKTSQNLTEGLPFNLEEIKQQYEKSTLIERYIIILYMCMCTV